MSLTSNEKDRNIAILTDADNNVLHHMDENEVHYETFANSAAEMITQFYDPTEIRRRSMLSKRTTTHALKLLGGISKDEMDKKLMVEFVGIDKNKRGNISESAFVEIVGRVYGGCDMSPKEMTKLIGSAEKNHAGRVLYEDFVPSAYMCALNLKRETIRSSGTTQEEDDLELDEDIMLKVPPTKAVMEQICLALFSQCSMESRNGELVLAFSEESSAVSTGAIKQASRERQKTLFAARKSSIKSLGMDDFSASMKSGGINENEGFNDVQEAVMEKGMLLHKADLMKCQVVNEEGASLDVNDEAIAAMTKTIVQQFHEYTITVESIDETRKKKGELVVRARNCNNYKAIVIEKYIKMPSLALVDLEAATMFAVNVCNCIKVVKETSSSTNFLGRYGGGEGNGLKLSLKR